jgi:hypothetical protein
VSAAIGAISVGAPDSAPFWYACAEAERPTDAFVRWHLGCSGCLIKAEALLAMHPADSHVRWLAKHLGTGS